MNNEQMEEIKRHFGVVAEGVGHKIQLVAEGVANLDEKFDREMTSLQEENEQAHREILFSFAEYPAACCGELHLHQIFLRRT